MSTVLAERPRYRPRPSILRGLGQLTVRHSRAVLLAAGVVVVLAGWFGASATGKLSNGGYVARSGEAAQVEQTLGRVFGSRTPNLILLARTDRGVDDPAAVAAGRALTERVARMPGVGQAVSYWTTADPNLRGRDGRAAVVAVLLDGDEDRAQRTAHQVVARITGSQGVLTVSATGEAEVNAELRERSDRDLTRAELLAAPVILVILLLVFRTPLAAVLPFVVGVVAVVLTLAILRMVAAFTPVSVFALNLTTALGFGLAIDYSLFFIVRFREERRVRAEVAEAVSATVCAAGRTVLFSALTVAVCLSALLVFPLYFLRSLAYAGIPVVAAAGVTAVILLPAVLLLCGRWLERGDVTAPLRRMFARRLAVGSPRPVGADVAGRPLWGRIARVVVAHPLLTAAPVTAGLLVLVAPFLHARFGLTDDRVLPSSAAAYRTARAVEANFHSGALNPVTVLLSGAGSDRAGLGDYVARLSAVPHVAHVDGPLGRYVNGRADSAQPDTPAAAPQSFVRDGLQRLSVVTTVQPYSAEGERLVHSIRSLAAPGVVRVGGLAAVFVDTKAQISKRLPYALGLIALTMFVLLFLFTGGLLVPVKALVFNALSLTASFGATVYIFQDGHLKWLVGDFVAPGYLDVTVPVLMFCVAFGLSMDYELFLLSRIREEYAAHGDNTRAVVAGLTKTSGLISAAALLVGAVLVVLATSGISLLKLLGVGLFLAVLVDALLIRGVLVPSFMQLAGRANWWAPPVVRRLHARLGIRESQWSPGPDPAPDLPAQRGD